MRIFGTVTDTNMKQLEKNKETQVFVVNIDYNMSAASGAPIAIKGKWRLKCKGHIVASDRTSKTHSLAPWIPGRYFMRREGPGIPTSDAAVP
jgi:hypothetical protein